MPENDVEMTHGQSDHAARLLTATRLYLISPPVLPQNWGQISTNHNDYNYDPMAISHTFQ